MTTILSDNKNSPAYTPGYTTAYRFTHSISEVRVLKGTSFCTAGKTMFHAGDAFQVARFGGDWEGKGWAIKWTFTLEAAWR
jgi:hypothetical protein